MSDDPRDPWRLPSVERFGEQLRELERSEHRSPRRVPPGRFAAVASIAALAAALIVVALLDSSGPADASSPVNRAPSIAVASKSVMFHSRTTVVLGGRLFGRFSQDGMLDFATGQYRTLLDVPSAGVSLERRRVDGVLYSRESHGLAGSATTMQWSAARLPGPVHAALVSAANGTTVTDPVGLLRILEKTRSLVRRLGRGTFAGVPSVRYAFSSDLASVVEAASGSRAPSSYRHVGAEVVVALDGKGRPLSISEIFSSRTKSGLCTLSSTVRFSGYGRDVHIVAPAGVRPITSGSAPATAPPIADPARLFERLVLAGR